MVENIWENEWEGEEELEDMEVSVKHPGRGIGKEAEAGKASEKPEILSDVDVLAAEVLTNRKLLAVFLELGERPKQAKELVHAEIWDKRKVKKIVKERVKDNYGFWEWKEVEKEVEEEGFFKLPGTTTYRLLRKLVDTGLVKVYRGLDFRKKYYKLTDLGKKVLEKVLHIIKEALKDDLDDVENHYEKQLRKYRGHRYAKKENFEKIVAKKIGVKPSLIAKLLQAKTEKTDYSSYILIDYSEKKREAAMW